MLKKLFSHTVIYGLAPQIVKLVQVLMLPIITPFLTAEDFGVYGIVVATVGAVSVLATLGLGVSLSNAIVKSPKQYKILWRQLYGFLNLWSLVYALIVAALVYMLLPEVAMEHALWIVLLNVLPVVLFGPSSTLGMMYYQVNQMPMQIAIRTLVVGLISALILAYCVVYLDLGYMGWFIATACSQFCLQASYFIPVNFKLKIRPIYQFKWKTIKRHVLICLPTIPHYYSNYIINSFDRIAMTKMGVPLDSIGRYNASTNVGNLFASATYAANMAVTPLLLQTYKKNDKKTEKRLNLSILLVFLIATFIASLFSKELIPLLIRSEGMENIYPLAIILMMSFNYRPMYVAANQKLFYLEKTKNLLKVTTVAAGISVVLNFTFIPIWGALGVAIVAFICNMYMGYSGFFLKVFKESDRPNYQPLLWLGTTVGLTILAYFAVEQSIGLKILLSALISIAGLVGLFWLNRKSV